MGIVGSRELRPHGRVRRTVKRASPPAIIAAAAVLIAALIFSAASCKRNAAVKPPSAGQEQSGTGIIATRPQLESSLHDFLMAEFERLGIDPARAVAKAPSGSANAVFDFTARLASDASEQPASVALTWTERLIGDYDQSGAVGISDITPIALSYLKQVQYESQILWTGGKRPTGDPDDDGGAGDGNPPSEGSRWATRTSY